MDINILTKSRRITYNDGHTEKIKYYEILFSNVLVRKCGCGGVPKLIQTKNGRECYDYCGESVTLSCDSCGILFPNITNTFYYDTKKYNRQMQVMVIGLIKKWNNVFRRNALEQVNYTTS